jgi:hypothetical protein
MKDTVGRSLKLIYKWSQWSSNASESDKENLLNNIRDEVKYLIDPKLDPELNPHPQFRTKWFEDLMAMELPDPD